VTRVAVVTGGASGIGRATAELLKARGVSVAVFDTQGDDPVDVSDNRAVSLAVDRVHTQLGRVDVVVNAAGIPAGGPISSDAYVDSWQRALA
jgi:3-oxoacyl-[acyl-carrier protein] reductase